MKKLMVLIAATALCVACNQTAVSSEDENATLTEEATQDEVVSEEVPVAEVTKHAAKKPTTPTTTPATDDKTIVEKVVDKVNTEVKEGATVIVDEAQKITKDATTTKKKK
jgi:hypothetical protein